MAGVQKLYSCYILSLKCPKSVKSDTLFLTKTAENLIPFGAAHTSYIAYIREYPYSYIIKTVKEFPQTRDGPKGRFFVSSASVLVLTLSACFTNTIAEDDNRSGPLKVVETSVNNNSSFQKASEIHSPDDHIIRTIVYIINVSKYAL